MAKITLTNSVVNVEESTEKVLSLYSGCLTTFIELTKTKQSDMEHPSKLNKIHINTNKIESIE